MLKNLFFFSTCSNYGLSSGGKLLKENDKLQPLSLYAKTKVAFENFLIKRNSPVQRFILRISTLYGVSPRMRFDLTINEFTKKVCKRESFEIFHADTWRPYLNLKDLSQIIFKILSLEKKLKKTINIFNVGYNNQNFTKKDIINTITKIIKKSKNFSYVSADHFDKRNYKVDFSKINKIKIIKNTSLQKGIKEIKKYLLSNAHVNFNKKVFYNHK